MEPRRVGRRPERSLITATVVAAMFVSLFPAARGNAASIPETFVTMISEPGDYIGGGVNRFYHPDNATITVSGSTAALSVSVSGGNRGDSFRLEFSAPRDETLTVGSYEGAQRSAFREAGRPGIDIGGSGRGCNKVVGRFEVKHIAAAADGSIESLWIVYEQHCEGPLAPALIGEVRYQAPGDGGTVMVGPREVRWPDTDRGAAAVVVPVAVVNPTTSPVVMGSSSIAGQDADLFSVRIDECAGSSLAKGDACLVWIRFTSDRSGMNEGELHVPEQSGVTHKVGLRGFVFGGVTRFVMQGTGGEYISRGGRYSYDPSNATITVAGTYQRISMSLRGTDGSNWRAEFDAPDGDILAPGTRYEPATRYPFNGTGPGLSISGQGRACNTLTGWFEISDISIQPDGTVEKFGASFEQRCDGGPPLYGVLDFRMPAETSWPDPGSAGSEPSPSPTPTPSPSPTSTASPSPSPSPVLPSLVPYKVTRHDETDLKVAGAKEAWTYSPRNAPRKPRVLLKKGSQPRSRISRKGFVAHAGGMHGNKLVYQQRRRPNSWNSQIRLYNTKRNSHRRLPARINTKHFEWAPAVQGRWLAFTRVEELSHTSRSVLWLANLKTGKKEVLESRLGSDTEIRSTQMAGRYLTWERCTPECEVLRYDRRTSTRRWIPKPRGTPHNYAPSVTRDGTVYFARSGEGCGANVEFYRFTTAGGNEKLFDMPAGRDLRGSWAVPQRNGTVRVYLDLVRCRTGGYDIYFVDLPPD